MHEIMMMLVTTMVRCATQTTGMGQAMGTMIVVVMEAMGVFSTTRTHAEKVKGIVMMTMNVKEY